MYEFAILLMHFMKKYFNSFDDIQFFHTFSSISLDIYIVMLNKIHSYIQNFMFYKMMYFSNHKFAFSNLHFLQFYKHFSQLCEKYVFKLKIKYIMLISSLSPIWWCTYIWLFLKKTTPPTPLHWTIQNILLTPNPFHCFFAKSLWAGKNDIFIVQ